MKQHYIPRCYLKRFTNNEKSIYAYDKIHCRRYNASLMSVCCETDLYTMSDEYVKDNNEKGGSLIDRLTLETEHFAHTVEPLWAQYLQQLDEIKEEWVTGKDHYRLNYYEKRELALHIITQYFRLPQIGSVMVDDYLRMERAGIDIMKEMMAMQTGDEEFRKLDIGLKCEKSALHAKLSYLDNDTLMMFANAISNNIFVYWISKENDFYTSDFPIVVTAHVRDARPLFMGLAQYGGELTIPLSPSISLSIYDRCFFNDKKDLDGCFIDADEKVVKYHNELRYKYATQHVFSYKNDFSLIEYAFTRDGKHPFLKPNYRTEIVSGLGRY